MVTFTLKVTSISTETRDGSTASIEQQDLIVTVNGVADDFTLSVSQSDRDAVSHVLHPDNTNDYYGSQVGDTINGTDANDNIDAAFYIQIPLDITFELTDTDNSEVFHSGNYLISIGEHKKVTLETIGAVMVQIPSQDPSLPDLPALFMKKEYAGQDFSLFTSLTLQEKDNEDSTYTDTDQLDLTVPTLTEQANTIYAGGGDDEVLGGANGDSIDGGAGNDILYGLAGDDTLTGGQGGDTLYGGNHNDTLYGGEGSDLLEGESGNDTLTGGMGSDTLKGGEGNDTLTGGEGADTLQGGIGDDVFHADTLDSVDGGRW